MQQKTIKGEGKLVGRGLFGGQEARVVFRPAPEDSGVVFLRTDLADAPSIPALAPNVVERQRRTMLRHHVDDELPTGYRIGVFLGLAGLIGIGSAVGPPRLLFWH